MKPGTWLQPSSWGREPALDGEILLPGQQPQRAPLRDRRFLPGKDHRRQAREEYLKAESEHAFGEYLDAVNERVKKQQNLARTFMGWALVKDAHELDRLEAIDRYNRRLEEIDDRREARDERRDSRAERQWRAGLSRARDELDFREATARADRTIAECHRDIARFAAEVSRQGAPSRAGEADPPEYVAARKEEDRRATIIRCAERDKEAVRRSRMSEADKREAIERIEQACRRALKRYDLGQAGIVMPEDDEE